MKKIISVILIVMIFGCNKYLYVDDILQGKNLEKAQEISVNDFFNKRMQNKIRKINVGNWDVLFQNDDFVYIGKPRLKNIFSEKRIIDTLFKVYNNHLISQLPQYKSIEGYIIRQKIYSSIQNYKIQNSENKDFYVSEKYVSELKSGTIEIQISVSDNENANEIYILIFDKNTLELLEINKLKNKN